MKIALFTDSFLPGSGGTENVVLRLATELSKQHSVMVFAPDYHRESGDAARPFAVVRAKSIKITGNDFWAMPAVTKRVKVALDSFAPDIIHTHTLGMMADYANKYGKKHGIPVVCTVHTKYKYCYEHAVKIPFIVNMVINRIAKRAINATRVTAVSNSMAKELREYGYKGDITIVKNGHDVKSITAVPSGKDHRFTLLYVGLLIDYKNLGFSFEVLKELKQRRDDFVFYVVGAGPDGDKYKKRVKKLGLQDNVVFTGRITDREKLYQIYANADLMLFTSIVDTDGLVLLEGAEAGTPALVLEGTGSAERYVDGKSAFIVKNDKAAVVEKLSFLIDNPQIVKDVAKNALNVFASWEVISGEYLGIYREEIEKMKNKTV